MSKRGNKEGSIYQRKSDGRWVAAYMSPTGKRRYVYATASDSTQRAVMEKT